MRRARVCAETAERLRVRQRTEKAKAPVALVIRKWLMRKRSCCDRELPLGVEERLFKIFNLSRQVIDAKVLPGDASRLAQMHSRRGMRDDALLICLIIAQGLLEGCKPKGSLANQACPDNQQFDRECPTLRRILLKWLTDQPFSQARESKMNTLRQ